MYCIYSCRGLAILKLGRGVNVCPGQSISDMTSHILPALVWGRVKESAKTPLMLAPLRCVVADRSSPAVQLRAWTWDPKQPDGPSTFAPWLDSDAWPSVLCRVQAVRLDVSCRPQRIPLPKSCCEVRFPSMRTVFIVVQHLATLRYGNVDCFLDIAAHVIQHLASESFQKSVILDYNGERIDVSGLAQHHQKPLDLLTVVRSFGDFFQKFAWTLHPSKTLDFF